jgi:hypothetical protein
MKIRFECLVAHS